MTAAARREGSSHRFRSACCSALLWRPVERRGALALATSDPRAASSPPRPRGPGPRRRRCRAAPGMPPVPDPDEPLQRDRGGPAQPGRRRRARPRLRAERQGEHRHRDRPGDADRGRHVPRRPEPAARRAVLGPHDPLGREQRRGPTTGSLTPIDPTTGKPGQAVPVDDPYNLYFTPDGRVGDRRRRGAASVSTSATRAPWRSSTSIAVPSCAGVNHSTSRSTAGTSIATCEFQSGLSRSTCRADGASATSALPRNGMPQDIRVSPTARRSSSPT